MTRTTGHNIISTITIEQTILNFGHLYLKLKYRVTNEYAEPRSHIGHFEKDFTIRNKPAVLNEEGEVVTPAGTEFDDFKALITSAQGLESASLTAAIAHAESLGIYNEYEDPTDDFWNEEGTAPSIDDAVAWQENVFVAAGAVRKLDNARYRAKYSHVTNTGDYYPTNLLMWKLIEDTGTGYDVWVQPTGAHDAYAVGDIRHYPTASDPLYINTSPANVFAPGIHGWNLYIP